MEWMSILPLAGIVLGAIFLAFSIFLFIVKKGGVAGPMLMGGVLAGGLGSYYFVTGEEAASETTASSEEEEAKDEEEQKKATEKEDASEKEPVASEDTEEETSKESSAEETGENEESESEASDEEEKEKEDSESDREQSKEEEPVTGDAGGGAEEYEYTALYHLNDVYEELAYVAGSSESYYDSGDIDYEYYNSATSDIYSMDEAIEEARELQNPPEGYGEFQLTYLEFLDEMEDYSDKLYDAIEDYEYGYDYETLEEIITTTNTPVVDAVEVMNTESDELFEYLDLRYETQNADWEEDFDYD